MDRSFTVEELEAVRKWRAEGGYLIGARHGATLTADAIDALLARNPPPKPKMRPTREARMAFMRSVHGVADDYLQAAADAGLLAPEWLEPADG